MPIQWEVLLDKIMKMKIMKMKIIAVIIISLIAAKIQAQDFFVIAHDSSSVKNQCYLMVCSDQLSTGLVKMSYLKFDSVSISNSRIIPLKTTGLDENLMFFKFIVTTHGAESLTYVFCYNQEYKEYYRIESFRNNDFYQLYEYLRNRGMKLTAGNFKKDDVRVEGVDLKCLMDIYKRKVKSGNRSLDEADRQQFECLHYHYQPVTVY